MKSLTLALSLGLLLIAAPYKVYAEEDEVDDSDVTVLTEDNFGDLVKGSKYALVSTCRLLLIWICCTRKRRVTIALARFTFQLSAYTAARTVIASIMPLVPL